jgi:hypothetical protein
VTVIYCFDACSLIRAYYEVYPPRRFPSFWKHFAALAAAGRAIVATDVCKEVKVRDPALEALLQGYGNVVIGLDQAQAVYLAQINVSHPGLINVRKQKSQGDPFVIALAQARSATVVTEEGRGTIAKPKIPAVCAALNVPCINLLGVIDAEGWTY